MQVAAAQAKALANEAKEQHRQAEAAIGEQRRQAAATREKQAADDRRAAESVALALVKERCCQEAFWRRRPMYNIATRKCWRRSPTYNVATRKCAWRRPMYNVTTRKCWWRRPKYNIAAKLPNKNSRVGSHISLATSN
jgi:hypothetical protein